jgi:DNA adenine methylase
MGYIGSKAGAGVFHAIIAEMPPHSVYVEPFFGSGAIFHKKKRAESSIVIDRDPGCVAKVSALAGVRAICGDALEILPTLTLPADALVYCDPPYLLETRKNRRYYKFEMESADHLRLLDILRGAQMPRDALRLFFADLRGRAAGLARLQVPSGHARRAA